MAKNLFSVNIEQVVKGLDEKKLNAEKVLKYTVSDFRSKAPGWVSKEVRKQYNISAQDIKAAYKGANTIGAVSLGGGTMVDNVSLKWAGRALTPTHFKMTPAKPPKLGSTRMLIPNQYLNTDKGAKQVAAWARIPKKYSVFDTVFKGKKKVISGKYDTPVFVASVRGQKPLAFQRKNGSPRNEFESLRSISIPQMIEDGKGNLKGDIQEVINTNLEKRFKHHCNRLLSDKK